MLELLRISPRGAERWSI